MKNLLFLLIAVAGLLACTNDDDAAEKFGDEVFPQKWRLTKMSGSLPNSEKTGENMEWQEHYLLNSDSTFTKQRERNGISTDASGTFAFVDTPDGKFLELEFDTDSEIIGSCYSLSRMETLWVKSDSKLLGTWSYCDGPGLEYKKEY